MFALLQSCFNKSGHVLVMLNCLTSTNKYHIHTVLPAKSDSGVMFCLQSYRVRGSDRSLVY